MSKPEGAVRRSTRYAVNALLAGFILAGVAWVVPGLLGYDRYVITGDSMSGTFEKGSVAFERQVPVDQLAEGDVITYLPPADAGVPNLVTHRIVEIGTADDGARLFRTQGDANGAPDPWLFSLTQPTQPVVATTVPYVGHVFIQLADPQVRMLVIGLPAGLIALLALVELVRAVRIRDDSDADPIAPAAPVVRVPAARTPSDTRVPESV